MGDQTEIPGTSGMSTISRKTHQVSSVESELYLLIAKFLSTGVCQRAAEVLKNEIEEHQLLPKRVDWLGGQHSRNFSEIEHLLSQVSDDHLLKICLRIGPIIDKEIPPTVPGLQSLLGVGKQSLLRIKEDLGKAKVSHDYLVSRKYGVPFFPSPAIQASYPPSITKVLLSREFSGPVSCRHIFPSKTYARLQHFRRFLGHLSSVYCVLFDRTGKYIFTGADDLLVKIWSAIDGRLLASLRGHSAEITDMTVNYENTLLAAGSCDKTIRVWCVRTCAPVAVLCGHTAMVTSIQFCPYPKGDENYLVSTGNDGCICFWQWSPKNNSFNPKPLKFTERSRAGAQMICSSFSQGGVFLATGSTDHNVRVYNIAGSLVPEKILERALHTDRVDSIQFSNRDCRFISGSKDGTAQIWKYERQSWHNVTLKMTTKLPGSQTEEVEDSKLKLRVTMVGWTLDDGMVITAVSDHSVKVWDSIKGNLCHILKGHGDEVFVLESHPLDPRVMLSSGHDGRINLWDLNTGTVIKSHFNLIEGQGHGAVFDCKFSPDGQMFAATDSHGHLSIYGLGSADRFKKIPEEQFFHTDYRPLIRDINHHVLDEQTQTPPHLLPPPFLVDIDGNPYPPNLQRLVPGRENCNDSQLIPYIAVSAEGEAEILEPVRPPEDRPTIDDMIERLQQEQEEQHPLSPNRNAENENDFNDHMVSPRSGQRSPRVPNNERNGPSDAYSPRSTQRAQAGHSRVGMRRTGDIEGVRQSVGNWQSRGNQVEVPSWVKRVIVKPMSATLASSNLERRMIIAEKELTYYNTQKIRRPNTDTSEVTPRKIDDRKRQRQHLRFSLRTRGAGNRMYEDFETNNFREDQPSSSSSETETEQKTIWDDSSGAEESAGSGEDSDWIADAGVNVERTNARAKPSSSAVGGGTSSRPRRYVFSEEDDDENTEEEKEEEDDEYDKAGTSTREKVKPKSKKHMTKEKQETKAQKARKKPLGKKVPERYRPPEWLTDVMPHKVPYVPQVGDEVVYFRQGHELYVQAVKRNRLYEIFMRNQPWRQLKQLREQEVARIIQMSFENHIPRLCCLKLKLLNPVDEDENVFTVKYHDMPDVIDFLVLKQNYDQAMANNWKPGDRFRSAIDKAWWLGTIKVQKPFNDNYPDSPFQCYIVKWDNGERECMSPWDFEPIDPERVPDEVGGSVDISPDERQAMMYSPERFEWSSFGQDYDIDRILRGLNIISELSIAEPFVAPVDLVRYPSYAMHVAYPMDLGTIKARLQNRYYRRLDAVKFDMEYIKLNAERFNESGSRIVKQAKCLVELCMKFFSSVGCEDPMDFYNEMLEAKRSRSQDSQSELDVICSESDRDKEYTMSTRLKRKKRRENIIQSNKRLKLDSPQYTSESWKVQCSSLLDEIFQLDDSTPFRRPVSMQEYPDYRNIIDCPMDLSTVKEKLETNLYSNPTEFCKDMRLIFQNSRNYNTNKKSKIYSMTIRLSASFEEQFRKIASDWKSVVKYEEKLQNNQFVSNRRKPFSIVNSDVNSFSRRSNHHNGTNHKNNEIYQPGPSRRSIAANSAKYEEPCSSRSSGRPRRDDRHRSSSSSKMVPARNKVNHLRFKIRDTMTNGIVKNSKMKSVKMKAEKRTIVKKVVKQEKIENTESDEDESDKADSESEASSSFDDDEDCEEERKMRRRKVPPNEEVQRKLRPRSRNIRRSNRNTRSASQQLQESLTISNPFRNSRFKNLRSGTSPPRSPMRPRTRPTIHRLTSLRTHRMELHPSTTASRLSTLRSKRTISRPSIRSSAGSDSNESDQTSKSKANSNSTNSSKSASDSSEDSRSSSQNINSRGSSANEHSNNKEHSESDSESPELNPATDPRMRRSTRATTRDSTKATSSALLDSKPNKRKKLSPKILTRNQGQRTVRYMEESDDDDNYNYQNTDDENSQTISISSRGRLRKLIKHGKRLFSE